MIDSRITRWRCYFQGEAQPLLLISEKEPLILILVKRMPEPGDFFHTDDERFQIHELYRWKENGLGAYREIEALPLSLFLECPGCGGLLVCDDHCWVGMHKDARVQPEPVPEPRPSRPKKPRSGMLDAPLREIVDRRGNIEELSCGHKVHFKFFKFVDKSATSRRCLECCLVCDDVVRTVKRPRIF